MRRSPPLLLWLLWPSLLLLVHCTSPQEVVQDGLTGVDLSVHFEASLEPDQLRIRVFSGEATALAPFQLPETPRALKSSPQSFVLLVPDSMADSTLRLEIAGYALGELVASGSTEVTLRHQVLINGTVTLGQQDPCPEDVDNDGICDTSDACVDADGDGLGNGSQGNTGCAHPDSDQDDTDPNACADTDDDTCDDCLNGTFSPNDDGQDTDSDGACDDGDNDDDGDNVPDSEDSAPPFPNICSDTDNDGCDDCHSGTYNVQDDGEDYDGDGLCDRGDTDDDNDGVPDNDDGAPLNSNACSDNDADGCDDCSSGTYDVQNDGADNDGDGFCNTGDPDDDNDGSPDTGDSAPFNPNVCSDTDGDTCEDCVNGSYNVLTDGVDFDSDGLCNAGDPDDDNDGAADAADSAPLDPYSCSDTDSDSCDDCVGGTYNLHNDGPDYDSDGLCDPGDPDDDNDTVLDGNDDCPAGNLLWKSTSETDYDSDGCKDSSEDPDDDNDGALDAADSHDNNPYRCSDLDGDTCDDCASGSLNPGLDGLDTDSDGKCDSGDEDDDNDGSLDFVDSHDTDRFRCSDNDNDTCDDCASGSFQPDLDGVDTDSDGKCNPGDPDDDGDGRDDVLDSAPLNPALCADTDNDTCEDCVTGTFAPDNDGADNDNDGLCDQGDPDDDGDGVLDDADSAPFNNTLCADSDGDTCDDCVTGSFNPGNDGTDTDNNGMCNNGDPDDDGDGIPDGSDLAPLDNARCADTDNDTCDDCASLTFAPKNDGTDTDKDGKCNQGDPDDDGDLIPDFIDSDSLDPRVCADLDNDTCDDCAMTTWDINNDGADSDGDGICDKGDYCVHALIDSTWQQTTDCRVLVPAGYFIFGEGNYEEELELEGFYIDVFPVTAGQFSECVAKGPCNYNGSPGIYYTYHRNGYKEHPMNYVNQAEAAVYCAWKNGRLPTEIEWEKAARGEDGPSYPWGETLYSTRANYNGSNDPFESGTTPVGYYDGITTLANGTYTLNSPSDYGLYDMSGNVWEWTSTLDGNYYIVRGGSFLDSKNSDSLKTYGYTLATRTDRYGNVGFRCVEQATGRAP